MAAPSPEHARLDRGRIANDASRTGAPPPPSPPSASFREGRIIEKPPPGIIVGYAIASFRLPSKTPGDQPEEMFTRHLGDDVIITTVGSGQRLAPVSERFVVCDYFKSEMSEYDANYVFVPLEHLQHLLTMEDRATSIQIKLKDYADRRASLLHSRKCFPARIPRADLGRQAGAAAGGNRRRTGHP